MGAGADQELDLGGSSDSFYCLFYVRSFLKQLFPLSCRLEGAMPRPPLESEPLYGGF